MAHEMRLVAASNGTRHMACPAGSRLVPAAASVSCTGYPRVIYTGHGPFGLFKILYTNLYVLTNIVCPEPYVPTICEQSFEVVEPGFPAWGAGVDTPSIEGGQTYYGCIVTTTKSIVGPLPNVVGIEGWYILGGNFYILTPTLRGIG